MLGLTLLLEGLAVCFGHDRLSGKYLQAEQYYGIYFFFLFNLKENQIAK